MAELRPNSITTDDEPSIDIADPLCAVFRRKLKAEGAKYTPERAQILDAIIRLDGMFEAETLQEHLKDRGQRVSKATVYRTIKLLQEAGIIQRVLFEDEQAHYQLVYGRRPSDLLIRVDTGEVIPIQVPELQQIRDRLAKEHGLKIQSHRLQVFAVAEGKKS